MTTETDMPHWPDMIGAMGTLREKVSHIDDEMYPFTIPHLAATEDQIVAAEQRLGHPLDPQHRSFLAYGNGWSEFYMGSRLLSTEELGQGQNWARAHKILALLYEGATDPSVLPPREELYPITASETTSSVFVVWRGGELEEGGHTVLWLPWADVDPLPNFLEFFRMVYQDYEDVLEEADDS